MKDKKFWIKTLCIVVVAVVTFVSCLAVISIRNYRSPYDELVKAGYSGDAESLLAILSVDESKQGEKTAYDYAIEKGYKRDRKEFILAFLNAQNCSIAKGNKSSYELALEHNLTSTEKQWNNTLKSINEYDENNAYNLALENGFEGTSAEWLDCIKGGIKNNTIFEYAKKKGYKGNEAEWLADLSTTVGAYGNDGKSLFELVCYAGFEGSFSEWLVTVYPEDDAKESNRSTYKVAVDNGFKGTFEDWLNYFTAKNDSNTTPFDLLCNNGYNESISVWLSSMVHKYDGKNSAYNEAKANGYKGSEKEWNVLISNGNMASAYEVAVSHGYNGKEEELIDDAIKIYNGEESKIKSNAAKIIKKVQVNKQNHLIAELTDGTIIDLGKVDKSKVVGENNEEKTSNNDNSNDNDNENSNSKEEKKTIYTVVFMSYDDTIIDTKYVEEGSSVDPPIAPQRAGYIFAEWDKPLNNIKSDLTVKPKYEKSNKPLFSADSVKATAGSKNVIVKVSVANNPGILGAALTIDYDDSVMQLKSVKNGDAFNNVLSLTKSKTLGAGCRVTWDGVEIQKDQIEDGEILIMSFDINDKAPEGKYEINFSYKNGDVVDNNLKIVSPEVAPGYIEILY